MPENDAGRLRLAAWPLRTRLFVTVWWAAMASAWIALFTVPSPPDGWTIPTPDPSVPPGASGPEAVVDVMGSAVGNVMGWIALIGLIIVAVLISASVITIILTVQLPEAYLYAVWLEDPVLTIRHWYGVRRWNLSSTVVTVRSSRKGEKTWLSVRAESSRRRAWFRLRARPEHISALAGAITASRPGDPAARQAAGILTQVAATRVTRHSLPGEFGRFLQAG